MTLNIRKNIKIDFIDLVLYLWNLKIFSIASSILISSLFFLYMGSLKSDYKGVLKFTLLPESDFYTFLPFTTKINETAYASKYRINETKLLSLFISEFNAGTILYNAFKKNNYLDINNFESIEEYEYALSKTMNNFKIESIQSQKKNQELTLDMINNDFYQISFEGQNLENFQISLKNSLNKIFSKIRTDLINKFDIFIKTEKSINTNKILQLKYELDAHKEIIKSELNLRLNDLKDQALLAREINIEKNSFENILDFSSLMEKSLLDNKFAYLRGYKILEIEIDNIEKKLDAKILYDLEAARIQQRIGELETDNSLDIIETAFKDTELYKNKNFKPISINLNSLEIIYPNNRSIIFSIYVFILSFVFINIVLSTNYVINNFKRVIKK